MPTNNHPGRVGDAVKAGGDRYYADTRSDTTGPTVATRATWGEPSPPVGDKTGEFGEAGT